MFIEIIFTFFAGLMGLFIFLYYLRKGQFKEDEDIKYQIFRENEEE